MIYRLFSFLLIGILPVVSVSSKLAWSEVVPTEDVLLAELGTSNRLLIASFFNRSDVAPLLEKYGLSSEEAKSRIEALSDQEVAHLANKIESLPAGGDGLGTLVGAIVLVFFVLLVTDILGFTKVFPFTRSIR